jgi:hypothetical protein
MASVSDCAKAPAEVQPRTAQSATTDANPNLIFIVSNPLMCRKCILSACNNAAHVTQRRKPEPQGP